MAHQRVSSVRRLITAFGYSLHGLRACFANEWAFRVEVLAFIVLAPLAIWIGGTGIEQALLVGSLLIVLICELGNSALEAVVDRFGGEQHELSGRAKDMGSAMVLLAGLLVGVTWALVLWGRWW